MDDQDLIAGGKIFGMLSACGVGFYKFFGRYQTKGACKVAHAAHDQLQIKDQKLRDEKINNMHEDVQELKSMFKDFIKDFYAPRTSRTREGD
jgi:hypothetical protein